jgi:heme-degrading monooxygenase HmoA
MQINDLDPSCSLFEQIEQADDGPVTVVNVGVSPDGSREAQEACIASWQKEAALMRAQPGFISAQLYVGVGEESRIMTNIAVWESAAALKAAFENPAWQQGLELPPEGTVAYPVLVRRTAVPGICVA